MNRFTLKFDPALEADYRAESSAAGMQLVRIVLTIMVGMSATVAAIILPIISLSDHPFVNIAIVTRVALASLGVAGALLLLTRTQHIAKHLGRATSVVLFGLIPLILLTLDTAEPTPRNYLFGLIYIHLAACVAVPAPYLAKVGASLSMGAVFLTYIIAKNMYPPVAILIHSVHIPMMIAISNAISYLLERGQRRQFLLKREAEAQRRRADDILTKVLPGAVAERLRRDPNARVVDDVADAAVLFADLVGFTAWSAGKPASIVVSLLDQLFSRFDALTEQAGAQKIKTIGDAYMVAVGVPPSESETRDPAVVIAELALELRAAALRFRLMTGLPVEIRIGMHVGPVTAGIIGRSRFAYDLWGETVNLASRLETSSSPGQIQMSIGMSARLAESFIVKPRGVVELKGFGPISTFLLGGARIDANDGERDLPRSA